MPDSGDYFFETPRGIYGRDKGKRWSLYPRFPKPTLHGFNIQDSSELAGWIFLAVTGIDESTHPLTALKQVFPLKKRKRIKR